MLLLIVATVVCHHCIVVDWLELTLFQSTAAWLGKFLKILTIRSLILPANWTIIRILLHGILIIGSWGKCTTKQ